MADEAYEALRPLLTDRLLGPASKLAYQDLWMLAGGRPGYVTTSAAELGRRLGCDPRSARDWLKRLGEADLIEVVDRDRRGVCHVYVYHPAPQRRQPRPDPQMPLPLDLSAGVCAQEPPRNEQDAGVCAQEPPRRQAKPPMCDRADPAEGANCAGVLAYENPRAPLHVHVHRNKNSNSHSHNNHTHDIHGAGVSAPTGVAPIGGALAEVIESIGVVEDVERAKEALVAQQRGAVADPQTDQAIYRRVADAVYDHGAEIEEVEQCMRRTREARIDGKINATPGRYYLGMIRRRLPPEILGRVGLARQRYPPR